MKIPRKEELLRLQQLYKTDAKIAEALGGIPEYLVAYWRRKKNISRHTASKFSRNQIQELWERFGDDFRAGRELNISKAAFYSWRRKYGVLEKPAQLRLEQLELRLASNENTKDTSDSAEPQTATAKIIRRCRESWRGSPVAADWKIAQRDRLCDAPVAVCPGPQLRWPAEESMPDNGNANAEDWQSPRWCSPAFGSIAWQLIDACVVLPGQLVSGPKRLLGGLGGISALIDDSDQSKSIDRVIKVELTRRLPTSIDVEDVFLSMLDHGWHGDWQGAVVEFWGTPVERLSLDRKVKLCALTASAGAASALCPFDDIIRRHYGRVLQGRLPQCHPDRTAVYQGEHFLEGRNVKLLSGALDNKRSRIYPESVVAADEIEGSGVIIGPAALPYEIERVASLVEGRQIDSNHGGALLVCPASPGTLNLAHRRGWAQAIHNAGGSVLDVSLARRLGTSGLFQLAAGDDSDACVLTTGLWDDCPIDTMGRSLLVSARTAIERGLQFV